MSDVEALIEEAAFAIYRRNCAREADYYRARQRFDRLSEHQRSNWIADAQAAERVFARGRMGEAA